jgi:hypothetical protein
VGTWNAAILGNDTSAQTYESFVAHYDRGEPIPRIVRAVREEMRASLAMDEDRSNVELALALALWECGALDAATLRRVRQIARSGSDARGWQSLGASPSFLTKRKKAVDALVAKLAEPPARPRPRRRPPAVPKDLLVPGTCFVIEHAKRHFGFWIATRHAGGDAGGVGVVCLDLETRELPDLAACLRAHAIGAKREGERWRASQSLLYYTPATEDAFRSAFAAACAIVGRTRTLKPKEVLWSSSGFGPLITDAAMLRTRLLKIRELRADEPRRHRLDRILAGARDD